MITVIAVGIVLQPLPSGAVALAALGATVLTNTLSFQAAFASFGEGNHIRLSCKEDRALTMFSTLVPHLSAMHLYLLSQQDQEGCSSLLT